MIDFLLVIPARYQSKRLPGKPLLDINGLPMIIRTFNQCCKVVPKSKIIVATDDQRIQKVCQKENINTIMTSKKCLTGTDRIAEVSKKIKKEFYINVQGDEPMCNPEDIKKIVKYAKKFPKVIINGFTQIKEKKSFYFLWGQVVPDLENFGIFRKLRYEKIVIFLNVSICFLVFREILW